MAARLACVSEAAGARRALTRRRPASAKRRWSAPGSTAALWIHRTTSVAAMKIEDVLHRRSDLSTFIVHLTRDTAGATAKENLQSIIDDRVLFARSAMGWAAAQDDPNDADQQTQRVVCFSETPLEHVWALAANIEARRVQLKPYGVAFTKFKARKLGVNPVWYVDMTPTGRDWVIANALNDVRDAAVATGSFHEQPEAAVLPFIEPMGRWEYQTREFWWEREWRHVGDFNLPSIGRFFLCPEDEIDDFCPQREGERPHEWNRRRREFLDPRWGVERIIAHLGAVPKDDVTPFG
jgi:hypothetical protein